MCIVCFKKVKTLNQQNYKLDSVLVIYTHKDQKLSKKNIVKIFVTNKKKGIIKESSEVNVQVIPFSFEDTSFSLSVLIPKTR